jgi:hypothetical protein
MSIFSKDLARIVDPNPQLATARDLRMSKQELPCPLFPKIACRQGTDSEPFACLINRGGK